MFRITIVLAVSLLLTASTDDWRRAMVAGNAARDRGDHLEARAWFLKAVGAGEGAGGAQFASALNNLAAQEEILGNHSAAERLYQRSLEIWAVVPDPADGRARPLNNLALLYRKTGRYAEAEQLYRDSLALRKESKDIANVLSNLGELAFAQRKFSEAEDYYLRAIATAESGGSKATPVLATALDNLAQLQHATGRTAAEGTAERALRLSAGSPLEIDPRMTLASIAIDGHAWNEAAAHLVRAKDIAEQSFGELHAVTACVYAEYAAVLKKMKRKRESKAYLQRARSILRSLPQQHTVSVAELMAESR